MISTIKLYGTQTVDYNIGDIAKGNVGVTAPNMYKEYCKLVNKPLIYKDNLLVTVLNVEYNKHLDAVIVMVDAQKEIDQLSMALNMEAKIYFK